MIKIAVVIVTYNGMSWIEKCFESLYRSEGVSLKVYVVDNGSTDDTVLFIKTHYPEVLMVQSNENLGFGKANNLAVTKALKDDCEFIFLLNQDGYVFPDTLKNLCEASFLQKQFSVLSPIQLNGRGNALDKSFSHFMNSTDCPGFINDTYFDNLKKVYETRFVMAAFWLIPRDVIDKIGLFNPVFPHYGEDDDFLNKMRAFGGKAAIVTQALACHDREFRENSDEKKIYMKYIYHLIRINDVKRSFLKEIIFSFIILLSSIFKKITNVHMLSTEIKTYHNLIVGRLIESKKERKSLLEKQKNKKYLLSEHS